MFPQSRLRLLSETTPRSTRPFCSDSSRVVPPTSTMTAKVVSLTWSEALSPSWTPTRSGCHRTRPSSTLPTLVLPRHQTLCTLIALSPRLPLNWPSSPTTRTQISTSLSPVASRVPLLTRSLSLGGAFLRETRLETASWSVSAAPTWPLLSSMPAFEETKH